MAYAIGHKKTLSSNKKRIATEDIYCYLDVDYFDDNYCTYKGRTFQKGVIQPERKFVYKTLGDVIFIENAYYASGRSTECNAEFIIPAGTKYCYSNIYNDYIAETIIFNRYLTSGWRNALARINQNIKNKY